LYPLFGTGVIDTSGKFAAGVVVTGGKLPPVSLILAANLPPVSTTLAKLVAKFAAGVADTHGKFAAGVVDTGGNFAAGFVDVANLPPLSLVSLIPVVHLYLRIFPRSKKFETVRMGYSGAGGKLIHEKNQKQQIS